jgi:hypothetical protein
MPQAPPVGPPQKKKSGNGCLIALAIVGGLVALVVAVAAFAVYRAASSPEGKKIIGAIGGATKLMAEAQSAPGAAEVRALGCEQAMVIDTERMAELFRDGDASAPGAAQPGVVVVCQVVSGDGPTCDAVAHTYATAAPAGHRGFAVTVSRGRGSGVNTCESTYDASGHKLKDLPPGTGRRVPFSR